MLLKFDLDVQQTVSTTKAIIEKDVIIVLKIISKSITRWWVPISYAAAGGDFNTTKTWLWLSPKEESKTFTLTDIKA